jgi:hypothetical protein
MFTANSDKKEMMTLEFITSFCLKFISVEIYYSEYVHAYFYNHL